MLPTFVNVNYDEWALSQIALGRAVIFIAIWAKQIGGNKERVQELFELWLWI